MRLIDADELIAEMQRYLNEPIKEWDKMSIREKAIALDSMSIVRSMPTVEQKHGHWIVIDKDVTGCKKYECSNCGKTDDDYSEPIFCKHCGWANGRTEKIDEVTEDDG